MLRDTSSYKIINKIFQSIDGCFNYFSAQRNWDTRYLDFMVFGEHCFLPSRKMNKLGNAISVHNAATFVNNISLNKTHDYSDKFI